MRRLAIAIASLVLPGCATFPPGTKAAPAFPEDNFALSHNKAGGHEAEPAADHPVPAAVN